MTSEPDLLRLTGFLDPAFCERLVSGSQNLAETPAPVYGAAAGGSVDSTVRKVSRVEIANALREALKQRFYDAKAAIEEHFQVSLSRCDDAEFLHYRTGDFFVAHQDGNTPLTLDDSTSRRISAVLFLNEQSLEPISGCYGGGALVLHGAYPDWQARYPVRSAAGMLVAFRSEVTHEVTPITHGDRYTIVTWYR